MSILLSCWLNSCYAIDHPFICCRSSSERRLYLQIAHSAIKKFIVWAELEILVTSSENYTTFFSVCD